MKAAMKTGNRTQWTAATVAVLASLLTIGGPLLLADHYAQTGAGGEASGYYVAEQTRRSACPDNGNSPTAAVSKRADVQGALHALAA